MSRTAIVSKLMMNMLRPYIRRPEVNVARWAVKRLDHAFSRHLDSERAGSGLTVKGAFHSLSHSRMNFFEVWLLGDFGMFTKRYSELYAC